MNESSNHLIRAYNKEEYTPKEPLPPAPAWHFQHYKCQYGKIITVYAEGGIEVPREPKWGECTCIKPQVGGMNVP